MFLGYVKGEAAQIAPNVRRRLACAACLQEVCELAFSRVADSGRFAYVYAGHCGWRVSFRRPLQDGLPFVTVTATGEVQHWIPKRA